MSQGMGADDIVADLHVHTTVSDGTLTLEALPEAAQRAGIQVVAVTDHDRIHPELDGPLSQREGVTILRGIELRVDAGFGAVDLLGYGLRETDALIAELDRLQRDRVDRAQRIIARVEAETGIQLDVVPSEGIGRPHIARAIERSDAPYDYEGAFNHLIGNDGPCYVARDLTSFHRGVELLKEACALVGLAHPFRYESPESALDLCARLDAVERYYPYDGHEPDLERLDRLIAEQELLTTGGSDAHGGSVGKTGLPGTEWSTLRRVITSRVPQG